MTRRPRNSLPYDIARCPGNGWTECEGCLRRLAPDNPIGWQTFIYPNKQKASPEMPCVLRISAERNET